MSGPGAKMEKRQLQPAKHPNAPGANTILGNDKPCSLCEQGFFMLDICRLMAESLTGNSVWQNTVPNLNLP